MNNKLELEFSELLIASASNNQERMSRILHRLSYDQKEKLAISLLVLLGSTFNGLPPGTVMEIQRKFGFELTTQVTQEVASCQ